MTSVIEIRNVSVNQGDQVVLEDITYTATAGKIIGVIGPNGAGKSTLLKTILGFLPIETGEINILGMKNSKQLTKIGYIPQRTTIDWDFPINALDVVLMGRYGHIGIGRTPRLTDIRIAQEALEKMDLKSFEKEQIQNLSGGQQQRVFLARALVQDTPIYLMDEPLVGVDAKTERIVMETLKELKNTGKTILIVHHQLNTVKNYFDEVILLNKKIQAAGDTNKVFSKENIKKTYGETIQYI